MLGDARGRESLWPERSGSPGEPFVGWRAAQCGHRLLTCRAPTGVDLFRCCRFGGNPFRHDVVDGHRPRDLVRIQHRPSFDRIGDGFLCFREMEYDVRNRPAPRTGLAPPLLVAEPAEDLLELRVFG